MQIVRAPLRFGELFSRPLGLVPTPRVDHPVEDSLTARLREQLDRRMPGRPVEFELLHTAPQFAIGRCAFSRSA